MRTFILIFISLILGNFVKAQQNTLQFFIERAKENSPFINRNKNHIKLVRLDMEQIRNIYTKPEISFDASVLFAPIVSHDDNNNRFEWASPGRNSYSGYDQAITDGGQYQALLSAKQPLFTGPILNSYLKKTDLSQQIDENNIVLSAHEIEDAVRHQFILTLLARKQANIDRELLLEFEKEISILQKLVENAIYKQSDLKLLQIEYQNYLLEYQTFSANYRINSDNLKLLCGIADTTALDIADCEFQLDRTPNSNSKFLTSFNLDSLNVIAEEDIFSLKYKPQISLFVNTGLNAVYQPAFDRLGFGTGLTLSWTIFDGNQLKTQNQKTKINLQTIDFDKQNTLKQNEIQKSSILNQINSLSQRIATTEEQLKQYDTLIEMYRLELAQADISVMDFKYLLKDLSQKKQENLSLRMEKQILINAYNYWNY